MTGRVMELHNVITPDMLATRLTERWWEYETLRNVKKTDWEEVRRYVYATNSTQTTNNPNPWKNKTTIPKLCQIRDNLLANYIATLFPQRKWLIWEPDSESSAEKRDPIQKYMNWAVNQPMFKQEIYKILMDYIDFGNGFATVEWLDMRNYLSGEHYSHSPPSPNKGQLVWKDDDRGRTQAGYIGPMARRISPLDLVMNPTAENFLQSPKIIRTILSMGELREYLQRLSNDDNREDYEKLFEYLKEIRFHARTFQGDWIQRDHLYNMDGFSSFRAYLLSDYAEILTFYGDFYDYINDIFEKNRVITVIDRHRLISNKPNPSFFGYPPIFHVPWRKKQDNLWGMGPLDNLIGMQYRLDHTENMRADVVDLGTFPVQKVKGFVEDYTWQPGEKIFTSDEGDVELVTPDTNLAHVDLDRQWYSETMEQMAGAPKEAMGFRSPGEKTKYEVQRLENASARIYQNKIKQFEEEMLEPILNAMLELARRNLTGATTIKVFDDEFNVASFESLTVEDITGVGRIKPVAARHFAEQADLVQNLTNLTGSNLWQTVQPHFSGIKIAKMLEQAFNVEDFEMVRPFISVIEQAEGQKLANAVQEQVHMAAGTATGRGEDFDLDQHMKPQSPFELKRAPSSGAEPGGMLGTQ